MSEHFLNRSEVGASLQQVSGEGVAEEVGVDAARLQPRRGGQPAEDEEGARAGERAALRIEEELGPVAPVEVRPPPREVAAERFDRLAADRDDALLRALAEAADEPAVEVDRRLVEAERLADAEARAVQELDERAVAERAWRRPVGCLDQPLRLAGRERARQRARAAR